jgi:hypothetical protein
LSCGWVGLWQKEILVDLYDLELSLNFKIEEIIWNVTDSFALTLKPDCEVFETRYIFNSAFSTFPLGKRVTSFQSIWKPDENSSLHFTSLLNHLKKNTLLYDKLCSHLYALPICGDLIETLATSGTIPPDWSYPTVSASGLLPPHTNGLEASMNPSIL